MAYDGADSYLLMFGGLGRTSFLNDTWSFTGGNWSRITPSRSPSVRYGASMAYDAADGYVVLFGGIGSVSGTYTALNDTWIYAHGSWTELRPTRAPSARWGATMAYDARDHYIVLFGGAGSSGPLNDTWTFAAGHWAKLVPTLAPPSMVQASLVDDAADGYLLLFGSGGLAYENWTFRAGAWSELLVTGPKGFARDDFIGAVLAYDPAHSEVLLFGGTCVTAHGTLCRGNTWTYRRGVWTALALTPAPGFRDGTSLSYDRADRELVLFGGVDAGKSLSGTWVFT